MPGPHAVVARWCDLWSSDRNRLVAELYRDDAQRFDLADPDEAHWTGHEQLAADEERLFRLVPDHRAEVLRVLVDGATRCVVEGLVLGTSSEDVTTMVAPALWWWELDGAGRIGREWRWLDWSSRRLHDGRAGTGVPDHQPPEAETHSQGWYRELAARFAETWAWDPVLAVRSIFADDCVVGPVEEPDRQVRGQAALEAAEMARVARLPRWKRRMEVRDVLGEGRGVAIRYEIGEEAGAGSGAGRAAAGRWPAVLVATLDAKDRIESARIYGRGLAVVALPPDEPPGG